MTIARHDLIRTTFLAAGWLLALAAAPVKGGETADALFRQAVESSGQKYGELRSELVARADETSPVLDEALKTGKDWRTRVTAEAIRGWIRHPRLYQELWEWQAPESGARNPFPRMAAAARVRFSAAGKDAIPLMLELIWKKRETQYGALPQLLAEWNVESAIPVLVEWMVASEHGGFGPEVSGALGRFGERATPSLLAALPDATPGARAGLVQALGLTGDLKGVDELRRRLKDDPHETVRERGAEALGRLKQYAVLREVLPDLQVRTRVHVIRVLADDKSDDTRQTLIHAAAPGEPASLRSEAVRALLKRATAEDVAAVCGIAPREPDDKVRNSMYISLGMAGRYLKSPQARKLFLESLDDPSADVRVRAIEGLHPYDDQEVNQALLSMLAGRDRSRRAALWILRERQDPAIVDGVLPLLDDAETSIREYAAEALGKNPAERALRPLIGRLGDPGLHVRRLAVEAIIKIGGGEALAALTKALPAEQDEIVKPLIKAGIQALSVQSKK
jgi:HEAT repeat protein